MGHNDLNLNVAYNKAEKERKLRKQRDRKTKKKDTQRKDKLRINSENK